MTDLSSAVESAVRAVRGESDLAVVMPALGDPSLARVIACAPDTDRLVRAVAAIRCHLLALLDPLTVADPALHGAMAHVIGTRAGREALRAWAAVAPAGWGRAHAEALIDAVHAGVCDPSVAAALIGPGDEAAGLLHEAWDVAFAIRHWGQTNRAAPDAWAKALAHAEWDRLIDAVRSDSSHGASCLPWLPPDVARAASETCSVNIALEAFADASPTARRLHAAIVSHLVARTRPGDLDALTRLACATGAKTVWRRVQTLIRESPDDAWRVVAAAPWDALPDDVGAAILRCADRSTVCAAVAAARGDDHHVEVTHLVAIAFSAALVPAAWNALDAATQRRWRMALRSEHMHLLIRALGPQPEILAWTPFDDTMARAVQRHARDEDALLAALLPVALCAVDPDAAHAVIAAFPTPPPDPGAFFSIAGGRWDSAIIAPARSALRSHDDLAVAVTIQRCCRSRGPVLERCTALQHALRGRSHDDLTAIMPLLDATARAVLMPDADALVAHLAHPDRHDALRRALEILATLPPEVAMPTSVALHQRATRSADASDAADALADALRDHGDLFLELADALTDDLRAAVLPLPEDAARAGALRAMAHDAPPSARRLALALRGHSWRDALAALLHAPPRHAGAVWQALAETERHAIVGELPAGTPKCAPRAVHDPLAALALAAVHAPDVDLRAAGVTALAARPDVLRACWTALPPDARQSLLVHPAVADLPTPPESHAIRRGIRR